MRGLIVSSHNGNVISIVLFFGPQVRPVEMRAIGNYEEEGKLKIDEGDTITVIEGR